MKEQISGVVSESPTSWDPVDRCKQVVHQEFRHRPRTARCLVEVIEILWDPLLSETQKNIAFADVRVGFRYVREAEQMADQEKVPFRQAWDLISPESPGKSFRKVREMVEGKAMIPVFGSATVIVPGTISFLWQRSLVKALLGISHLDGGGPGTMETSAQLSREAQKVIARAWPRMIRRWTPDNYRVLLLVGKREQPHEFCHEQNTVWGYDQIMGRTEALLSLGEILACEVEAGGLGTDQEFACAMIMNQLRGRGEIDVPFKAEVPIVLIDSDLVVNGRQSTVWQARLDHIESQIALGTVKREDTCCLHRIHASDPQALDKYVEILRKSSIAHLDGVDIVSEWESILDWKLTELVRLLAKKCPFKIESEVH